MVFAPHYIALILAVVILSTIHSSHAEFTNDFRAFIHNRYGLEIVNQLERRDLGADASLGGKDTQEEQNMAATQPGRQRREAVLIVHGITNKITRFNVSRWVRDRCNTRNTLLRAWSRL